VIRSAEIRFGHRFQNWHAVGLDAGKEVAAAMPIYGCASARVVTNDLDLWKTNPDLQFALSCLY